MKLLPQPFNLFGLLTGGLAGFVGFRALFCWKQVQPQRQAISCGISLLVYFRPSFARLTNSYQFHRTVWAVSGAHKAHTDTLHWTHILSDPFTNWTCFLHYGIVACVAARFFLRNSCPGPKVSCVTCDSTCNKQWNLVYLSCMQRSCNSCTPVFKYSSELYILLWPLHLSISVPSSHR